MDCPSGFTQPTTYKPCPLPDKDSTKSFKVLFNSRISNSRGFLCPVNSSVPLIFPVVSKITLIISALDQSCFIALLLCRPS